MHLHAEIRVTINAEISYSRCRNDGVRANPEWTSWKLMPPASSGTPERLDKRMQSLERERSANAAMMHAEFTERRASVWYVKQ